MKQSQNVDRAASLEDIGEALHHLCQPLTTLQCRLELAEITNTEKAYREAVALGINECERLADCVRTMRNLLQIVLPDSVT